MPIYEYRCPQCGTEFEKLVSARTAVTCPSCASVEVTRRLSLFRASVVSRPGGVGATSAPAGGCCGGGGCGCH